MMTPTRSRLQVALLALLTAAATLSLAPASLAQNEAPAAEAPAAPARPSPDTVVATVGGEAITEADLSFAAEDLGQELQSIPPDQQRAFLVTVLIDMKVMAKAAREAGLDASDVFKRRQKYLEDRSLRRAYFADVIAAGITPDAVRSEYDGLVADFQPQEEIQARHILVASEDDAKAIKKSLDEGVPFEQIAKEKSMDGSAQNGGDLGFFGKGRMVKPFEDAAFALADGQVSEPVQSQFGWHVIKVEGRRQSAPPAFEQVAPQLQQNMLMRRFDESVSQLKDGVAIDIPDPGLAAAVNATEPAEGAPAEGTPAEGAPAEGTPAEGAPAEGAPAEDTPAEAEPAN